MLRSLSFAHNDGFTLAEVLITLVIIGVIAAITVPTLIVKYQKEETVTRLKKAYSSLSQAVNSSVVYNGPMNTWDLGENTSADNTIIFLNKYILPYLSIVGQPTNPDGGWNTQYKYLNGTTHDFDNNYVRFYLNDGVSITSCLIKNTPPLVNFFIDINGDKKPNKWGRDIFTFQLYPLSNITASKGKLYIPYAVWNDRDRLLTDTNGYCNKNREGDACAAVIIKDGWQIKDDYPW